MVFTDPLSPAAGATARLGLAAGLVLGLWLLVLWAMP
jgi:hypothetical protein